MKYLLDTHMLLWWQTNDKALPHAARALIANPQNHVAISTLTLWEIIIKTSKGKLQANVNEIRKAALEDGFNLLAFNDQHALEVERLPLIHHDPFDRGLIATACHEEMLLLTANDLLVGYGSSVYKL